MHHGEGLSSYKCSVFLSELKELLWALVLVVYCGDDACVDSSTSLTSMVEKTFAL